MALGRAAARATMSQPPTGPAPITLPQTVVQKVAGQVQRVLGPSGKPLKEHKIPAALTRAINALYAQASPASMQPTSGYIAPGGKAARANTTNVPNYVPKQYVTWVQQAARGTGLPASVVAAQIQDESGFDPNATSPTGAQGMAQVEPGTFKPLGIKGSPYDPAVAQQAYTRLMSSLLKQYNGNVRDALAAYNAGSGNIQAGYGYADNILSAARIPRSATGGASTATPIVRPGGGAATSGGSSGGDAAPSDGSGVDQVFAAYEAELTTPRTAPPGVGPFQFWWSSFTNNWEGEQGASS